MIYFKCILLFFFNVYPEMHWDKLKLTHETVVYIQQKHRDSKQSLNLGNLFSEYFDEKLFIEF